MSSYLLDTTLALVVLSVASVSVARATTTYGSQATVEASGPALTFQGVNLTSWIGSCTPCSTITDSATGVTFTAASSTLSAPNATTVHFAGGGGAALTVTLPSNVLAFGGSLTINGAGLQVQFTGDAPNGNYSNLFTTSPNYLGGRVAAGPITGLSYTLFAASSFDLGGFEVGSTPEAGTLLSMGAGLLLIGAVKRRARQRPS